ncbi:RPA-related protein RADX isoform X1 [Oncorhynchus kisutch]|uniref:RPA-related protein RADX isoform X1 n=1 Tax=Oncorhynchus kisutch TaxID=8019 RepID=UPI0012DFE7DD|nr:RPA-related protein RADX-like isoform X1 [Oncorhynchus kisutch]
MASVSCPLQRTLSRPATSSSQPNTTPVLCRERLWVLSVQRYGRDPGFSLYFPQNISSSDSLYDATLTDGDCRLRVTLDPSLNRLVERNVFRCGSQLRHVTFSPGESVEEEGGGGRTYRLVSVEVAGDEGGMEGLTPGVEVERLPWYGAQPDPERDPGSHPADPALIPDPVHLERAQAPSLLPLRARRSCYLPLWNNQDYSGPAWRETPNSEDSEDSDQGEEGMCVCCLSPGVRATVTLAELQEDFLSRKGGATVRRGVARGLLVVRVLNKSRVMYYGKSDSNCECPYKAVLEVCDVSGCVCVCVLWNSVCVSWYGRLRPGQVLRTRGFRVKESYDKRDHQHIEISLNSRNPSAEISIVPEFSLSADVRLLRPSYSFCNGKDLLSCPHGNICDVIGLVVFSGRPERIRSKDGQGAELLEYRWLRLDDGTSDQPIMIKLFSTSQPETHNQILPLSVVVCTRLQMVGDSSCCYLTNTTYTQIYCTGSGHHSVMPYRKLHPVRQFVRWLRSVDDRQVLSRAVVGGYFIYPPPPVSLEAYMKNRKGELGLLRGAELKWEVERLQYRERRSFCIQATITMVTHCHRGKEDQCLVWTDRPAAFSPRIYPSSPRISPSSPRISPSSPRISPSSPRISPSSPRISPSSPRVSPSSPRISPSSPRMSPSSPRMSPSSPRMSPSSPRISPSSPRMSPSSPRLPPSSPGSSVKLSPSLLMLRAGLGLGKGKSPKRKPFSSAGPPRKRLTLGTHPEEETDTGPEGSLWEASMEFLETNYDEDEDDDDQAFLTAPSSPVSLLGGCRLGLARVAMETVPLQYCPASREEQAVAVEMQTGEFQNLQCCRSLENYSPTVSYTQTGHYTLTLRALSDGVVVDAVFLPGSSATSAPTGPSPPHGPSHSDHWFTILTHGGFSPHTPPPAPADLIATASQLANQRLVCVLELCLLGGDRLEVVLSRAFPLRD